MTLLLISELAAESGVPISTLRYYERIGLVRPQRRSESGYRLYDDAAVERVAFIGRAKRLGMSLDDVSTLIEAWFAGDCQPLQDRLRSFVSKRLVDLRRQIADESTFEQQLERVLARLDAAGDPPERCDPDCGCDLDPGERLDAIERGDDRDAPALACSLSRSDAVERLCEWRRLLALAISTERLGTSARFEFAPGPEVTSELARVCAAEAECCPFFEFTLVVTAASVALTVDGPGDAAGLFTALVEAREVVASGPR